MTTTPAPAYDPAALPEWKPRSPRLGQFALVGAVVVLLGSVVASVLIAGATAPIADITNGGWNFNAEAGSSDPVEAAVASATLTHIGLGTLFGIAAMVAGIIAIATKRGRGWGVAAAIVAFLAPGISLVTFMVVVSLTVQAAQLG